MKKSLPFVQIKVYNEQLQVSELNLPPPELQFNVGLLSEVDEIFVAYYQNSPFHKDHLIIMKLPSKVEIGLPMPQHIEADEAELKGYEEGRDSLLKHCSGDGGGNEDLHYLEHDCERGESKGFCNGDSRSCTKEEGAKVQCENIVISSLNGNNGNTITSAERVESTFEGNEEQRVYQNIGGLYILSI